jgi:hypothetical protein
MNQNGALEIYPQKKGNVTVSWRFFIIFGHIVAMSEAGCKRKEWIALKALLLR